ncbi:MAG: glyoxylate/hydroxypyruvate reductase A [Cyanobacteria bacterium J06634_6]
MTTTIPFAARLSGAETKAWLKALQEGLPNYNVLPLEALTMEQQSSAQVAIVANPSPASLDRLPNLKWVQSLWAGVEQLVFDMQDRDFTIVRMVDPQLAKTMSEAVLAWTLYLHRDMPRYRKQQSSGTWQQHPLKLPAEQTVGILGLGNLGRLAARKLHSQGFDVCGWSRSNTSIEGVTTFCGADGFTDMLQRTNILVCLLPLTKTTRGLIDKKALASMPKGASLINFARGPIVEIDALLQSLDSSQLSHAVLNVFDKEPLPPTSQLWAHPKITVLPHISAPTNKQTASQIVADNISTFFQTGSIPVGINKTLGY